MDEFIDFFSIVFYFIFIVFLIVFPIAFKNDGKSNSEYNKLHRWSVISLVSGVVLMIAFGFAFLINRADRASTGTSTPADGFTIPDDCKSCEHSKKCAGGLKCLTYDLYKDLNHKDVDCSL